MTHEIQQTGVALAAAAGTERQQPPSAHRRFGRTGTSVYGGAGSASGIEWVHDNAMSDDRYLPETLGPGCAFLDYDNDGWMDIYLVNSGPCDFWKPSKPIRNALYKNNRDGTFTDVTEKAGCLRRNLRHGRRGRRFR